LARQPGIEQVLVTKRGSELARRAQQDHVRVHEVPWTIGLDPGAWAALGGEILRFRPHIIHAHDGHSLWIALQARRWLGLLAWVFIAPGAAEFKDTLARVLGTRRVDFHIRRRSGLTRLFAGDSAWIRADHVVAVSAAVKQVLVSDGRAAGEVSVIPDGIDPHETRRAAQEPPPAKIRAWLGLPAGTPLAVNVAALVDHKDQHTLLRAAGHARATRPDLHWVIAGEGFLRGSLTAEIRRLGLGDRVHLLGYVEKADALIRECDVFVMSSKEEGLGSVILNALALEKPVVATAAGGIPEILPPESLVPVGDSVALAGKVVDAISNPASRIPFPERFTAAAMAQSVLDVYRSLL
jgi:L-malate glycosyltransferase